MNGLEQYKLRYNLPFISAVRAFYKAHENTGLSYHNWNHCLTTALRAEYLYDHTCFPVSHYELNNVFIAGLFHDIGYNKYNKHDSSNVIDACALFDQFCNIVLTDALIGDALLPEDFERIRELILTTQFPHKHTGDLGCQALQDADLTQNWTRPVEKIVAQLNEENYPNPSFDFPANDLLNSQLAKDINTAIKLKDKNSQDLLDFIWFYNHHINLYKRHGLAD